VIEIITGERGFKVVRRDGRLMASRFDPKAEAAAWVERRLSFLDKVKTVFVLGWGSGYHVEALRAATRAKIIVIEPETAVIEAAAEIVPDVLAKVETVCVQTGRELRAARAVREGIKQSFLVLTHPASKASQPGFFRDCEAQLNGREWGALTWQWQVKEGPAFDSTPRVESQKEPLTIYDLEQTELVQNSEERERMLFKALRELVK
jgi:hypothetical protein